MPEYYPVYLNLAGKRCVILGGGTIAQGKIAALRDAGADITIISPEATDGIKRAAQRGDVAFEQRPYREGDLEGAFIAVAATNVWHVNRQIFEEAEAKGVLLNVVDDPDQCTFIAPSIVRRDPITLAVSTGGASPALARKMRETLAEAPALKWADLAGALGRARRIIKEQRTVIDPTRWQCVITEDLLEMTQAGREDEVVDIILAQLQDDTIPEMCTDLAQCKAGGCAKRAALRAAEAVS
ncbi:MAG: bifunctional precorrin-2 dehydrogenase/sirohydrochlorin ferrochelatase [Chloroflexi bacterium]|nr:bifunctional precorrin-2 dehydrogenase/sirohydrochlorin ferrochelatase [Chloroflexota bacterium]MYD48979.1 bifunctional precorrin-2 dehydrogenase/sirohydrochlorin ferrochelatase [Chloroflexota bacterium]